MDKYIVVYGGKDENNNYCYDLHTNDFTTVEVIIVKTYGAKQLPCQTGCIAIYNRKLFVCVGDTGKEETYSDGL